MPSILLVCSSPVITRAFEQVLDLVLGGPVNRYPPEGVMLGDSTLAGTDEFWVMAGVPDTPILRIAEDPSMNGGGRQAVLRARGTDGTRIWTWYLAKTHPDAGIRLVRDFSTAMATFTPDRISTTAAAATFSLDYLRGVFHDLAKLTKPFACLRAAAWLATLSEPLLSPYSLLSDRRFWVRMDDRVREHDLHRACGELFVSVATVLSHFRAGASVVGTCSQLREVAADIRTAQALSFWHEVCDVYYVVAGDGRLSEYAGPLADAIEQWYREGAFADFARR